MITTDGRAGGLTRSGQPRIEAIDQLRGLMIVLMVLDHVRDFFHGTALTADPLAMDGDPALFATRWITHLCAPAFVLLAGVSIWLQQAGGKRTGALSRFLLTRGLFFVLLELTIIGTGFNFGPWLFFQVIWALGVGMMVMAVLIHLPRAAIAIVAAAVLLGSPLLMLVPPESFGALQPLFRFGVMPSNALFTLVAYPALPWLGVLILGYLSGPFVQHAASRPGRLALAAVCGLVLFMMLRAFNIFGLDYRPWSVQADGLWTIFSFVDVSKYPPSLLFILLMGSLTAALLALLIRTDGGGIGRVLAIPGRTAMFVYLLHIWLAHGLALGVGFAWGIPPAAFMNHLSDPSRLIAAGWGFGLVEVWCIWLLVLALLWPLSVWYDRRKQASRHPVFSYL